MQTNTLFMGWTYPKTGRESQAGELFDSVINYCKGLQRSGKIDSFEPVILGQHGGELNGFFLIRGVDNIDEIRNSDEFVKLALQCGYTLDGFGVVNGYSGEEVTNVMKRWRGMVGGS
jgi:hypothetical protein